MWREFCEAARRVGRAPRFTLVIFLTLSLAVGATGAIYSLVNNLLLRQLPVAEPHRLVVFYPGAGAALFGIPLATLEEIAERQQTLSGICGVVRGSVNTVEANGVRSNRSIESVTGKCYEILAVQPQLGRLITANDAPLHGATADVVVISDRFWRSLGGSGDIIGSVINVQGVPLTVIGVMPPHFTGLYIDEPPDVFVPLGYDRRSLPALHAIGVLRPGYTLSDAREELRALWPEVWSATNPGAPAGLAARAGSSEALHVESLATGFSLLRDRYRDALRVLLVLATCLLLLACLNLSGLVLARAIARDQEFAIRSVLGASRGRLTFSLAAEGAIVGFSSGLAAVGVSSWVSAALAAAVWTPQRPMTLDVTPDLRTLFFLIAGSTALGVLVSGPSILVLPRGERRLAGVRRGGRVLAALAWRRILIAAQVAISLTLLFCAGLFARNLAEIRQADVGYPPSGLHFMRLSASPGAPPPANIATYLSRLLDEVSAVPRVTSSGLSLSFPTTELEHLSGGVSFASADDFPGSMRVRGLVDRVWPGFFRVTGIPLQSGRDFTAHDDAVHPAVGVINEAMVTQLGLPTPAIGQRIRVGSKGQLVTVVGVARDASPGDPRISNAPIMYRPILQEPQFARGPVLLVRMEIGRPSLEQLRAIVEPLGYHEVGALQSVDEQMDRFLLRERLVFAVSVTFALVSALIGGVGLYALLAYAVALRRRELGVRIALGASSNRLLAAVAGEALLVVAAGAGMGVAGAVVMSRIVRAILSTPPGVDSVALVGALVVIAFGSLAAVAIPARHALRIDPARLLRYE